MHDKGAGSYFLLVPSPTRILLILSARFLDAAFFSMLLVDPSVFKFVAAIKSIIFHQSNLRKYKHNNTLFLCMYMYMHFFFQSISQNYLDKKRITSCNFMWKLIPEVKFKKSQNCIHLIYAGYFQPVFFFFLLLYICKNKNPH